MESSSGTRNLRNIWRNQQGAIDLASIMVGVIILAILTGIVGAAVFAVVPWMQDNTAKQRLSSLQVAESSYSSLLSSTANSTNTAAGPTGSSTSTLAFINPLERLFPATPSTRVTAAAANSYGTLAQLSAAKLYTAPPNMKLALGTSSSCYAATIRSDSGNTFWFDSLTSQTQKYTSSSTSLCADLTTIAPTNGSSAAGGSTPTSSPSPTAAPAASPADQATFVFNCPAGTTNAYIPVEGFVGTVTWGGGTTSTATYTAAKALDSVAQPVTPGTTYTATLKGTFTTLTSAYISTASSACLTQMNNWGSNMGTTSASYGFLNAVNLTNVPNSIPSTVTNTSYMFRNAAIINDPNISNWNTSNITNMSYMFVYAAKFNQPVNSWSTTNVTNMQGMFYDSYAFNQPVSSWNVAKVTDMSMMFEGATVFNQPLSNWTPTSLTTINAMFMSASAFNQPLNTWSTPALTNTTSAFENAVSFNQPLNSWNVTNVTTANRMFYGAKAFNQPLSSWSTAKMTTVSYMFSNAIVYSQDLSSWNVAAVTAAANFNTGSAMTAAQTPAFSSTATSKT